MSRHLTLLILFLALACAGAEYNQSGNASGTTLAEVTFPPMQPGPTLLVSVDVTSDKAASVLSLITGSDTRFTTGQTSTNPMTVTVNSTNGLAGNVFLYRAELNSYSLLTITNRTATTVTLTATGVVNIGNSIMVTLTNSTPIGAATLRLNGEALAVVPPNSPLTVQVDGTSSCKVNNAVVRSR
jgi:hypothetical protein